MQKALPVAAAAAGVGLAAGIFIDAPSTQQPHALRLARADARGLRYRGVAANSSAATLANFALSLDAVFEPVDEATFRALRRDYGGWSETASAVKWRQGEPFTLLDLLPPLFQATSGRHFRTGARRFRGGEATRGFNCWGLAWAAVPNSNLQLDFNVSVRDSFDEISSAVLRELDQSNRFVQKSAESTSI